MKSNSTPNSLEKSQEELLREFFSQWETGKGIHARTSGSTGTPKEILLPQSQVERSARRSIDYFGITSDSRLHSAMSFKFIGGKMMIARSLLAGCQLTYSYPSVCLIPPSGEKDIDLICLVPAQMPYILDNPELFSNIRGYLIGGSAIDDRLWDRIVASGIRAWESYAMTETATHVAMRRIEGPSSCRPRFIPLPGIDIHTNSNGCICIKDEDVEVVTRDLGQMFPDGSFYVVGRVDDVINTGGIKVMPQEVEKVLALAISPYTTEFFLSSVPDEVWTNRLVIAAVPLADSHDSPETFANNLMNAIMAIPEEELPKRMRPKGVVRISELPRTEMGKLNRTWKFSATEVR